MLLLFFSLQASQHSEVHLHPRTRTHPAAGLQGGGDGRARDHWRGGFPGPVLRQAPTLHRQLRSNSRHGRLIRCCLESIECGMNPKQNIPYTVKHLEFRQRTDQTLGLIVSELINFKTCFKSFDLLLVRNLLCKIKINTSKETSEKTLR